MDTANIDGSRDNRCHALNWHYQDDLWASGFGGGFFVYW
jgi:hypothetical protein